MRWNSKITSRADIRRIMEVLKGEVASGTQSSAGSVISMVCSRAASSDSVCRIRIGFKITRVVLQVLKTDYHLRSKYRLVLLNGENVILDINATNRMQKATPGTTDICVPLAWEDFFGVLLKTHEELAHMLTGRKLHDKVKGRYVCGSYAPIGRRIDLVLRCAAIRVCPAWCVTNSSISALSATKG